MANVILKVSIPADAKRELAVEAKKRGLSTSAFVLQLIKGEASSPVRKEWSEEQWMTMLRGVRRALKAPGSEDAKPAGRRRSKASKRKGAA